MDYRQEKRDDETHTAFAVRCVFEAGAAVAFGLMGMAEVIRAKHLRIVEVSGWEAFDECYRCGCGRLETEALMPFENAGFICAECSDELRTSSPRLSDPEK